jgi:hypothetical protein
VTTSGPSPRALHQWLTGSLALTRRAVAALADDGPDVPVAPLDPEKVVGEALLLLRSAARVISGTEGLEVWQDLYDAVAPLVRPESLGASLCREPATALETAFSHIQLSALGDRDAGVDLLLDLALTEPACGPEPYVVAALHRVGWRGLREDAPDLRRLDTLLERSSLGRPVDVLRCTTQDAYDLTHAVMHGTDLGSWTVSPPRPADELVADLGALLGIALDAENLDLTAELLWSWPMLRLPSTPTAGFAFAMLSHAHDEHGFLPGPGFDPVQHATMPLPQAATYVLRTSYHASLVFGMLAAAVLDAPDASDRAAAPRPMQGGGRRLLDQIDAEPSRAWRLSVPDDESTLDALAPMLLAIALRRRSDQHDLAAVRSLLELALEHDLADGQVVRQAATLLRRGAALARHRSSTPVVLTHTAASPARKAATASAANPTV